MPTETSEKGLDSLIVEAMTCALGGADTTEGGAHKPPAPHGGSGWLLGSAAHYDCEYMVDLYELRSFL